MYHINKQHEFQVKLRIKKKNNGKKLSNAPRGWGMAMLGIDRVIIQTPVFLINYYYYYYYFVCLFVLKFSGFNVFLTTCIFVFEVHDQI